MQEFYVWLEGKTSLLSNNTISVNYQKRQISRTQWHMSVIIVLGGWTKENQDTRSSWLYRESQTNMSNMRPCF